MRNAARTICPGDGKVLKYSIPMIIRLVKMAVRPDQTGEFERVYSEVKGIVRAMPGCRSLELLHDLHDSGLFFTWSLWDDESALERYRNSETYRSVWPRLKAHFVSEAQAWSVGQKDVDSSNYRKD